MIKQENKVEEELTGWDCIHERNSIIQGLLECNTDAEFDKFMATLTKEWSSIFLSSIINNINT